MPLAPWVLAGLLVQVFGRWQQLQPSGSSPDVRTGHVGAFSEADRSFFVFGGVRAVLGDYNVTRDVFFNDLWKYSVDANRWEQLDVPGKLPPKRLEHAAAFSQSDRAMYVHGGGCETKDKFAECRLGDLWKYSLESGSWRQLATSGSRPSHRWLHTAAYSEAERALFVFGGEDLNGTLNDLWKYSVDSDTWELLRASDSSEQDSKGWMSALWNALSPVPAPLASHSAVFCEADRAMLVFGGWGDDGAVNDLWKYHVPSNSWQRLAASGSVPAARGEHAAAFSQADRQLFIFGGWTNYSSFLDDFWQYSVATGQWQQRVGSGSSPACRTEQSLVFSAGDRACFLFGGMDGSKGAGCKSELLPEIIDQVWLNDLWKYSEQDALCAPGEVCSEI